MVLKNQRKFFDIISPDRRAISAFNVQDAPKDSEGAAEENLEAGGAVLRNSSKQYRKKIVVTSQKPAEKKSDRAALPKASNTKKMFILIFGGIATASLVVWMYFVLPQVKIQISPKVETLNFEMDVIGERGISSLDLEKNKIPAELFSREKEISQEFQSTGKKLMQEKAHGIITVFNNYSSSPQTLVKTTRFISQSGKLFRSIATVTIPGAQIEEGKIIASSQDVEVIAEEAGEDYNIGPSTFSIPGLKGTPKYLAFYGQSKFAMAGGIKREVSAVSQEDIDRAIKTLTDQAKQSAESDLATNISGNFKIIDDAQETKVTSVKKPEMGIAGEKFTVAIKAISRILTFNESDIRELIKSEIGKDLIPDEKEGLPTSLKIVYSLNKFPDFDKGILDMKLKIEQKIAWKIEKNALQKEIAGQDEKGMRNILSKHPAIDKAQVTLWPFWVKKAPGNSSKIKIIVEYNLTN